MVIIIWYRKKRRDIVKVGVSEKNDGYLFFYKFVIIIKIGNNYILGIFICFINYGNNDNSSRLLKVYFVFYSKKYNNVIIIEWGWYYFFYFISYEIKV